MIRLPDAVALAVVRANVDKAPPLTPEQVAELRRLLTPEQPANAA